MMTPQPVYSVLDRERVCACCHKRPAVLIFDRDYVCARCHQALDRALDEERRGKSKRTA